MIKRIEIDLWGRHFSLPVEYENYYGDEVSTEQLQAVCRITDHPEKIIAAKKMVETYCHRDVERDKNNKKKDNIFSYVQPRDVYVKSTEGCAIGIMCNYRYNEDDGLAIVFYQDGTIRVGEQGLMA